MKIVYLFQILDKLEKKKNEDVALLKKTENKLDAMFLRGKIFAYKNVMNILKENVQDD